MINLDALYDRCAMHHHDIRTCIYFRVRPFLDPIGRH
jgi:hypothetical protein